MKLTRRGELVCYILVMLIAIGIAFSVKGFWWTENPVGVTEIPNVEKVEVSTGFAGGAETGMNEVQCMMKCGG